MKVITQREFRNNSAAATRAARYEQLGAAIVDFDPLPFDAEAATRYGTLVALTLAAKRDPRPRAGWICS
ncbi:hypothetical protein [Nocardia barduliensis]|uniref:hypothetical protein n=1 Tax=Nocardia barduliensis TaxID=2736643 RepID=UPI001C2DDA4C|nr:hypothetical protein [Nocardia barduliensis]